MKINSDLSPQMFDKFSVLVQFLNSTSDCCNVFVFLYTKRPRQWSAFLKYRIKNFLFIQNPNTFHKLF
jgi:hypothetical protein